MPWICANLSSQHRRVKHNNPRTHAREETIVNNLSDGVEYSNPSHLACTTNKWFDLRAE